MEKLYCPNYMMYDPIERILKRQSERKKVEDKTGLDLTNYEEIEKFNEDFAKMQNEIEKNLELTKTLKPEELHGHFTMLNEGIQALQKFYSNAIILLRIYDKKICQGKIQMLRSRLTEQETQLLPKKKFGFKSRTNRPDGVNGKTSPSKASVANVKSETYLTSQVCGFCGRTGETLSLAADEVDKKDVLLSDLKNCRVHVYGNPSTMHLTNLDGCVIFSGPVTTSVFVEKVTGSALSLACQQLRVHETVDTDFFLHVTSKAIIEDSRDVRFGVYKFTYDGLSDHYKSSGLSRDVNNWNKVDDFNWLAADKPSPNWSVLPI